MLVFHMFKYEGGSGWRNPWPAGTSHFLLLA